MSMSIIKYTYIFGILNIYTLGSFYDKIQMNCVPNLDPKFQKNEQQSQLLFLNAR